MQKKILKLADLCEYLAIPRRTLYRMIEDGRFDVKPMPRLIPRCWRLDDVNAWLERGK